MCLTDRNVSDQCKCETGRFAIVSGHFVHAGKEKCLRGTQGTGTIYFSPCNLKCVFCQNQETSHEPAGLAFAPERLARAMIELQEQGCHNIHFVTPSHVVPQIIEAVDIAISFGLHLPLVYNTSSYDSVESIKLLENIIDIFVADFKFYDTEQAAKYLYHADYPDAAMRAIREMHRQVGDLVLNKNGIARKGLIVRHLILPGMQNSLDPIFHFIATEVSPHTWFHLMDRYFPAGVVDHKSFPEINRRIIRDEFDAAMKNAKSYGLYRFDLSMQ